MRYRKLESSEAVVLEPPSSANSSVIWLHGLGADGHDFVPLVPELRLPASLCVRFVFPHAPLRPVTINNGYKMRAWYDIVGISLASREDEAGIRDSENRVRAFMQREIEAGVAANRIVIAGFSQGGAIALQTALRYPQKLAGVMALSTYLPLRDTLRSEAAAANSSAPVLMCHGRDDNVVPMSLGTASRDVLTRLGYAVDWNDYQMAHQVCAEEVNDIAAWLSRVLAAS